MSNRSMLIILSLFVTIIIYLALVFVTPVVVRRLPADFFTNHKYLEAKQNGEESGIVAYYFSKISRFILGLSLIVLGTVFLQGILVVILGLGIMDFPGKAKAVRSLVRIGFVWGLLNNIRSKANLPLLEKP